MCDEVRDSDEYEPAHGLSSAESAVHERLVMLPCPFCGELPEVDAAEDNYGTWYEFACDCGLASSGVQISDLMTIEERAEDEFINDSYQLKYRERARDYCIKQWNTRAI